VIVLALVVLPARLLATTANDLCAASADPCTVSSDVTVDTGSMLDLGTRELHVASGGALDVGTGAMTLHVGKLTIDSGGSVRALGDASNPGGTITINTGDMTVAGTIDVSGSPGGTVTAMSSGALAVSGTIAAGSLLRAADGGIINIVGGSGTVSGTISAKGGFDGTGGDLSVDNNGDLTISGKLDASGGDGGCIDVQAGTDTTVGNLVVTATAVLSGDATTAGGFGGEVDATAAGDGVTTGLVTIEGLLSATGRPGSTDIGGGDGGCVSVEGSGPVVVDNASAKLTADGGSPDGDGGEVDVFSDKAVITLQGTVTASCMGTASSGGVVTIDGNTDVTINGSALCTGGSGGGGDIDITSDTTSISVSSTAVVDVSSTSGGDGGGICLAAGPMMTGMRTIVVEGRLAADGGAGAGGGGSIDLESGDAARVTGSGTLHASGGSGGGAGGTLTVNADPGIVLIEGPLVAVGATPNGAGGVVSIDAGARVSITGSIDGHGGGTGGQIGIASNTGPIDILATAQANSIGGAGGSIEVKDQGDVHVGSSLISDGSMMGGTIAVTGCSVTVCGLNSSSCPAGGKGVLSSKGPSGVNRVTGNNVTAILGTMTADASTGHNQLVYDGTDAHAPLVLGQVTPAATLVVDQTIMACPICGDHIIEPPETCDDGNTNDGDGCSSMCQIETPIPGDANGDSLVTPDDVGFCITEIFDGDGDLLSMVSGGSFHASPGVDANGDKIVSAADVTATIKHLPTSP
jgi:cysteine-rich repeat protein